MADSNFLVFGESVAANDIETDSVYQTDTQRISGVVPGIAGPALHNKLYKQVSIMAAAMAQVIVQAGFDALDSDYTGLVKNMRRSFAGSVNNVKPDETGNIDLTDLINTIKSYATPGIGEIILTKDVTNPSEKYTGTTWELLEEGTFLMSAGGTVNVGSTGGSNTHTNTLAEMAPHDHPATCNDAGGHDHNGTTGSVDLSGNFRSRSNSFYGKENNQPVISGATNGKFSVLQSYLRSEGNADSNNTEYIVHFDGKHEHPFITNLKGVHKHGVAIAKNGSGKAWDSRPKYLAVYMWIRTA